VVCMAAPVHSMCCGMLGCPAPLIGTLAGKVCGAGRLGSVRGCAGKATVCTTRGRTNDYGERHCLRGVGVCDSAKDTAVLS